jgi:hypothetical protein
MRSQIARHLASLFATAGPEPFKTKLRLLADAGAESKQPMLPREFSWHDYAVYLLHIAAEIEHSLMVQYLYAAYSIGGPEVPADKQEQVLGWQQSILGIAKEEMGHFLTVQNILRLIGGALNLDRQDFPWDIPFYPYDFALEPLTRTSLAKYIFAEAPDDWPPDLTADERKEIEAAVHMTPQQMPHRVAELYELMIDLLSDADALPDSVFREETFPFQASWDEWGRGYNGVQLGSNPRNPSPNVIVQRLSGRTDAVSALTQIARQGEAPENDPTAQALSHFRRFLSIFREFPRGDAKWVPTWKVPTNPQAPGVANSDAGPVIEHPESSLWSTLFNVRYRMLLAYLAHSFRISSEPMEMGASNPRSLIINSTFVEMYQLRSIAGILVSLPLKDDRETDVQGRDQSERAGPPFQIPYAVNLPSEQADCWRVHIDLLDASDGLLKGLTNSAFKHSDYAIVLRSANQERRRQFETLLTSAGAQPSLEPHRRSIAV